MSRFKIAAESFHAEVKGLGARYYVRDGVVEVVKMGVEDSIFDTILRKCEYSLHRLGAGHQWGTDGVGYYANKSRHMVSVLKSPSKSVLKYLSQLEGTQ